MFNFTPPINKEFILSKVSESDIFARYLGIKPEFGVMFTNPLRVDNNPSCNFNVDRFERIKFYDPGGGFNWDCFNVVEYAYKVSFKEAMNIIARDFKLAEGSTSDPISFIKARSREKVEIRIKRREWSQVDKDYWWTKYGITRKHLEAFDISPVSHAWYLRGNLLELFYTHRESDPCYAYWFGDYEYKLYFPLRAKGKKFRQTRGDIIQGLRQLPEKGHILIHTKSLKDVVCISRFREIFGIHAIAPMSETQLMPEKLYNALANRFDYQFTLFDFDRTGIKLMRKYEQVYKTPWLMMADQFKQEGIKDFADLLEKKGYKITRNLMEYVYGERVG